MFSGWRKEAHSRQRTRSRRAKFRTSGGRATELRVYSWKWAVVKCQLQGGGLRRGVISRPKQKIPSCRAGPSRASSAARDGRTAPISRVSLLPREASLPFRGLQSTQQPICPHTHSPAALTQGVAAALYSERGFSIKNKMETPRSPKQFILKIQFSTFSLQVAMCGALDTFLRRYASSLEALEPR